MIITRTPLRISLGGGGTDLPSYYRESGQGFLIAAAITKYVYIAVHHNFDDDVLLKYSAVERVDSAKNASHPLLRECLLYTGIERGLEVTSMADIPAGTGLGSSGAFTVGVLRALHLYNHDHVSNVDLAREACEIEIGRLGEPIGKQDQYIAAVGGVSAFTFNRDETVGVEALQLDPLTRQSLDENLLLFFTGLRRSASEVLAVQQAPTPKVALSQNLDQVRDIGYSTRELLEAGDMDAFGEILTHQWDLKHQRSPGEVHSQVDEWIRAGNAAGAAGGKLVGAGGGGFLLFYAEHKADLRREMEQRGLEEVRFSIDYDGSTTTMASR